MARNNPRQATAKKDIVSFWEMGVVLAVALLAGALLREPLAHFLLSTVGR